MPRPGIPPRFEAAILEEAGKGRSNRDIAAWLKAEHGVSTSHVTVGNLLRRIRSELSETTRAVAVNEIAPQVVGHIAGLNEVIEQAKKVAAAAAPDPKAKGKAKKGNLAIVLKALDLRRKAHVDVLRVSGADASNEKAETLAELMAEALKQ
jgi:hypothetical protein